VGTRPLTFTLLPEAFAVCRLDPADRVPPWAAAGPFSSITRTADELSVVCPEAAVPAGVAAAPGWRCLKLEGPFDFSETGLVASFSSALARAGISLMAVCTYDTDYLLVRHADLEKAIATLEKSEYRIRR
jgi:uncharacterized protein